VLYDMKSSYFEGEYALSELVQFGYNRDGKHLIWSVKAGRLHWSFDKESIAAAKALDGCYVIKATVSAEVMDKDQIVARYKSLSVVEQAFRNIMSCSKQKWNFACGQKRKVFVGNEGVRTEVSGEGWREECF